MVAGAAPAGGAESQALDVKRVSPRVSHGDLVVFVSAIVLLLVGWAVKTRYDDRLAESEVGGVTVAYPVGWFPVPTTDPEALRVVSDVDARTSLSLTAQPTNATDVVGVLSLAPGLGSLAAGETAYTQLGNEPATVDGHAALRSDYAYVDARVGGVAEPRVIRGRQYAWIAGGTLSVLTLEAPTEDWEDAEGLLDRIVDRVEIEGAPAPEAPAA